jgi:hypothetical protein
MVNDLELFSEPGSRQVQAGVSSVVETVMAMEKAGLVTTEVVDGLRSLLQQLTG